MAFWDLFTTQNQATGTPTMNGNTTTTGTSGSSTWRDIFGGINTLLPGVTGVINSQTASDTAKKQAAAASKKASAWVYVAVGGVILAIGVAVYYMFRKKG